MKKVYGVAVTLLAVPCGARSTFLIEEGFEGTKSIVSVTGAVGSVTAGVIVTTNNNKTGYRPIAIGSVAFTESYEGDGAPPTPPQTLYELRAWMLEKSIVGTILTNHKLDSTRMAAIYSLDNPTAPTSVRRAL